MNSDGFLRSENEKINKFKYRRSYHYLTEMKKGDLVDLNKLTLVRPGDGISDNDLDKVCESL